MPARRGYEEVREVCEEAKKMLACFDYEEVCEVPATVGNGRFAVAERLGAGAFGEVRLGLDRDTGEQVAIKFEEFFRGFLEKEAAILEKLQEHGRGSQGFAQFLHAGKDCGGFRCLVVERLGGTLLDQFKARGGKLSVKSTVLIAEQLVPCLEYLHSKGVVHQDIKPENFLCGRGGRSHHLHLIDFGIAREYHDGHRHAPQMGTSGFVGSFRYAPLNAHRFLTQGRREDLEALGYMLVYLARGSLPWSGAACKDWRARNRKILEVKEAVTPAQLAEGLPDAFQEYLSCCQELGFETRPDYDLLVALFQDERAQIAELEGAPVKDHDLEWIDKGALTAVTPLERRHNVRQPDDFWPSRTRTRARSLKLVAKACVHKIVCGEAAKVCSPTDGLLGHCSRARARATTQ